MLKIGRKSYRVKNVYPIIEDKPSEPLMSLKFELWGESDVLAFRHFFYQSINEPFPTTVKFMHGEVIGSGTPYLFQVMSRDDEPLAVLRLQNMPSCVQATPYTLTNIVIPIKWLTAVYIGMMSLPMDGSIKWEA